MKPEVNQSSITCPITKTAALLSDTWTMLVVHSLLEQGKGFCDLERDLDGISTRTLTLKLKKLEEEKKQFIELKTKKKAKLAQKKLGHKLIVDWEKKYEKNLVKITTKGIVKLFNSIYDFRKKVRDDKVQDGIP